MSNKKIYRILSLLLCTSLLSGAIPNTVTAAELYSKNDTFVINDDSDKTLSEEAQSQEAATEYEAESSMETASETQTDVYTESVSET